MSARIPLVSLCLLTACISPCFSQEEGEASWYGGKFIGRLTSNGEVFDTEEKTAAHKTLPFETLVKVTNLENGKSTVVRINDRGPFVEGRVIDLSRAAAADLDMVAKGVARVSVEIIGREMTKAVWLVQVGAFRDRSNAAQIKEALASAGLSPSIQTTPAGIHRVVIPGVKDADLTPLLARLGKLGYPASIAKRER